MPLLTSYSHDNNTRATFPRCSIQPMMGSISKKDHTCQLAMATFLAPHKYYTTLKRWSQYHSLASRQLVTLEKPSSCSRKFYISKMEGNAFPLFQEHYYLLDNLEPAALYFLYLLYLCLKICIQKYHKEGKGRRGAAVFHPHFSLCPIVSSVKS